ncbi:ATPase [Streptomyces xiamenensis]|uniref:RapZ C-terminal domain-containing protein n=1 Tax=Streptomyces xiamenensis TaxID=408015 RepID=UPI0035DCDD46
MHTLSESPAVQFLSFGYGHGRPPSADLVLDFRSLVDPALDPSLRVLDARDPRVQHAVLATPGAGAVITVMTAAALTLRALHGRPVTVAGGCSGGRHRAPHLTHHAAERLAALGLHATTEHRDLDSPLLAPGTGSA